MALMQEEAALVAKGATPAQIEAWHQQNAARFAVQQQRAQDMAAQSSLEPMSAPGGPNIPANASQTLKDFLSTQVVLANARAQIHNQLLDAMPLDVTAEQISQMEQQARQLFEQQYGAQLQQQAQRAQTLAKESAPVAMPMPPPLQIPANATPQLAAYLTACDQLMREEIQVRNQHANAASSVTQAAVQQWRQQNAARFQQLQQLAQNLSTPTTN